MKKHIISLLVVGIAFSCSTKKTATNSTVNSKNKKEITFEKDFIDESIKPGDDFFKYANGTWVKNNPVPPSESRWGSFNELEQANINKITVILEGLRTANFGKETSEYNLGAYYISYTDMASRNKLGANPIKAEIKKIKSITNYSDISTIVADQHKNGISSLFYFGVEQDLKDVNVNISYLYQGGIGLPNRDYYLNNKNSEILKKYKAHVEKIFLLAGFDEKEASSASKNVVNFETALAQKMKSPAELRIPENNYTKISAEDSYLMLKNFDFEKYLSNIGSQSFKKIIIGQTAFFRSLNSLIKETEIEQIKDYLTWKSLDFYAKHLDEKFVKADFEFYEGVLSGKTEMKPLNENVINEITDMSLGETLGKLFVEKHFSENAQKRVNIMVDNLLLTFNERIKNLSWMSDSTKSEALNKLNSIGRKLGFPSKWENFGDLQLTQDNYIENVRKCNQRDLRENLSQLYKPIDKEKWGMPAHMVNAYYNPQLNEIAFPAGIMQFPFFDENAEDALNYGRIGMVIGHEFTHGFDDMGSKFAADGNFKNWWSEKDKISFEEKTKILGETFSAFCPIDGHCVNSELTMGENIADLGGITLAYYAYTKTEEFKSGEKKKGFTPAQRFFISFAQLWKINYTTEEMKNRIENDPHSPGMYRVNGPLMNCPEFFEAFGIAEGEKMRNSVSKLAKIW